MTTAQSTSKTTEQITAKKLKNFKYYQNKAIDFSKRNRLLKYPKRATSIIFDLHLSECKDFFGQISELKIDLPHKEILRQDEDQETLFEENKEQKIPEVVLPPTNFTGKKLISQLDKLRLQAKNNFDSHGLHTIFMAVGEIKWKEELAGRGSSSAISEWDYSAPLLLIPISITNYRAPQKRTVIELNDESYDVQINPVLNLFIKQQLELKIPVKLTESSNGFLWEEIPALLKKYQKILKEDKGLDCEITETLRIGQFTFHGQQIYEDLAQNEKAMIGHDVVSSLCGDDQINQLGEQVDVDDDNVDEFLTEEEDFTILDADESQLKAIKRVIDGKHMVIHGPPGTGKSQTIANLISNLLARGKKVLFVCEKQVALDVVYNRLKTKGADISDLCLPLFQYTSDKKFFAKSIIESRNKIRRAVQASQKDLINEKLAQRKERIEELQEYGNALLTKVSPLDKEVYWIHGELARVAPEVNGIVLPWRGENYNRIDFPAYQKIRTILSDLSNLTKVIFDQQNHWSRLKQQTFSPDYSARLFAKLNQLKDVVANFPKLEETALGNPSNVAEIKNILKLAEIHDFRDILENRLVKSEKVNKKNISDGIDKLTIIKNLVEEYQKVSGVDNSFKSVPNWDQVKLTFELLPDSISIGELLPKKNELVALGIKIETFQASAKKNKHVKELSNFNGESLRRYKNLFYTDPIVQKLKGWDERVKLYEIQNTVRQIKAIYDRLLEAQEVINEWAITIEDIDKKLFWDVEQRFTSKYKFFFRYFTASYRNDTSLIMSWCTAHRPQNFKEFQQIVFSIADKIRLQEKYEKLMRDFVARYASEKSVENVSISSLADSIEKIVGYLEETNIDRLADEIKTLFAATDKFDQFKQIINLAEEILDEKELLNSFVGNKLLNEQMPVRDVAITASDLVRECIDVISLYEKTCEFISRAQPPKNFSELKSTITTLNKLRALSDKLIAEDFEEYTNFSEIEKLTSDIKQIEMHLAQLRTVVAIISSHDLTRADFYRNIELLWESIEAWRGWYKNYTGVKEPLQTLMNNEEALLDLEFVGVQEVENYINEMTADIDGLEKWIKYQRIRGQLAEYGALWFVDDVIENKINKTDFANLFCWSFLNKVLDEAHGKNDALKNFNIADYERYVTDFRRLEKEIFEINQYRVLDRAYPNIRYAMNLGGNSERVIVRESQKVKRHLPIRKLVTENAAHILSYKPCWLMSPLTLSSYIPFGAAHFDVVIFDEASQMKIENAIGAISRAKQTVVIGDEHQLPPTSFFDVDIEEEDEEEMEDVGYESILQVAKTILPGAEAHLLYHYRSKHADLIAFSNNHIYQNLVIFPTPKDYKAIRFEFVENGIYYGGQNMPRNNPVEAQQVAKLCVEHFQSGKNSLGVIAFSKAQEEAIRDAINEKIKGFPHLADKFDETLSVRNKYNEESAFFIRNLESVQGDERDIIILSIGYGPDQNGNVYNRFGPINAKGGYRRLNVAITRAREQLICVTSMKFHQMSPSEGTKGAVLMQKYLEYAEKGRQVLDASKIVQYNNKEHDSDFEISVQRELESHGYIIHNQVGAAGYSIDLAVVHPDRPEEYVLGIECDGAAYHSSKSARIRDRLRQEILERLGWKIYRVWSQHWITHKQEVVEDIVKIINKLQ